MTAFNLSEFVRVLAGLEGIPEPLISAVVERAEAARRACVRAQGYTILGDGLRVLARRVVARAVSDHRRGVLERRCV